MSGRRTDLCRMLACRARRPGRRSCSDGGSVRVGPAAGSDSETFGTAALALGELERFEGNWSRAQCWPKPHSRSRGTRRPATIASNLNNLIMSSTAQRRTDGVREMLLEAMAIGEQVTVVYGQVLPLMLCAALAALQCDWERSARYEGAARFQFIQLGWPLDDPADRVYLESFSSRTRAALGDVAFERAREAGRALLLDEALRQVRQYLGQEP